MFERVKKNILIGNWALGTYLLYGGFLMFFLFQTVHDRSDAELDLRMNHRFERVIKVWIDHGFFKHAGLWFGHSVDEKPDQDVHWTIATGFLFGPYLLERLHVALTGEFSRRLLTYYNQLIPMVSSALLGFLAMRMVIPLGVSLLSAFLLGIGVQTAYQTLPLNLGLFWELLVTHAIPFMLVFLIIEEHILNNKDTPRLRFFRGLAVFFMFFSDFQTSLLFIPFYLVIKATTIPKFDLKSDLKIMAIPAVFVSMLWAAQLIWIKINHPGVKFIGSTINSRTGFDGVTHYYNTHWELFNSKWHYVFPSWNTMWVLGGLTLVAIVIFVQKTKKLISHQTIVLAGLGLYIPMAFIFSQSGVIHPYLYEPYLAIPFYLAFFSLLPAWLENFFNHSKLFVFFAILIAFSCSGIQLFGYFLHVPPYFYL